MRRRRHGSGWLGLLGIALSLALTGCWGHGTQDVGSSNPAQPYRGLKITVAAVGDPTILKTLASQRGEWGATRGAEVVIRGGAVEPGATEGVDLILFRGDRLGDLVDLNALAVLPETLVSPSASRDVSGEPGPESEPEPDGTKAEEADPLRFAEVVPAFRDQVSKYGNDRMALPYGGTALVLVYDRAAFEREENRAAAENAKLALELPRTWDQFDALARFFQGRDWDGDGAADQGVALPLGPDAEGLGDALFLARAAGLGQHRDQYSFLFNAETMAPRIDAPPFVAALESLSKLKESGPPGLSGFDAEAARHAFRAGKVAMLIDRAELAATWSHGKPVGVAPLPGSDRVYDPAGKQWEPARPLNDPSVLPFGGGWLIGLSHASAGKRREAAIDFARYLVGPDIAKRIAADRAFPMLPVRSSLLTQGPPDPRAALGVDARQWSDAVSRTLIGRRVVPGLRIPEADGYLADLARGRVAAVGGEPAEAALKRVADAWVARTRALGQARQTWHYRRSLNSLATLPEPPGR